MNYLKNMIISEIRQIQTLVYEDQYDYFNADQVSFNNIHTLEYYLPFDSFVGELIKISTNCMTNGCDIHSIEFTFSDMIVPNSEKTLRIWPIQDIETSNFKNNFSLPFVELRLHNNNQTVSTYINFEKIFSIPEMQRLHNNYKNYRLELLLERYLIYRENIKEKSDFFYKSYKELLPKKII